jgi:hypothetical protein
MFRRAVFIIVIVFDAQEAVTPAGNPCHSSTNCSTCCGGEMFSIGRLIHKLGLEEATVTVLYFLTTTGFLAVVIEPGFSPYGCCGLEI